jgi:CubicO group peptidase (beta-lactamase class C family)
MAKVAQMLLNKGAYGDMRFMRPETFEQMLPRVLTDILGPGATIAYGIGTLPFPYDGLGEGTFGHTAASVATLRIDPEHDLVISMTRNSAGRNFVKYHAQFLEAIVEGLAD